MGPIELRYLEAEPLSNSFDQNSTNTDRESARHDDPRENNRKARFTGWRGGFLIAIIATTLVLFVNVVLAITAAVRWGSKDGVPIPYTGDCATAARSTTVAHLFINILSSLLLGASNYCMQRLVAPTRTEIDKAHARKKWLDIGVPSVRNLSSIKGSRVALWFLLGLTSLPLHLLYNSVVYNTLAISNVAVLYVRPEFFTDKSSWSYPGTSNAYLLNVTESTFASGMQESLLDGQYLNRTRFENITGEECIKRYSSPFTTGGSAFAVLSADLLNADPRNRSYLAYGAGNGDIINPQTYRTFQYCICEILPPKCEVQLSTIILAVVIATNVLKLLIVAFVLWRLDEPTVVTIGDAVQSFIVDPDATTKDCCLMSAKTVEILWTNPHTRHHQRFAPPRRPRWFGSISNRRWVVSLVFYISMIVVPSAYAGILGAGRNGITEMRNGLGIVDRSAIIELKLPVGRTSMIPYVLLANLPQTIISFAYITYNALFTLMLANREWTAYSWKRSSLRVTVPSSGQRSTHFLQLPYSWGGPLLIASIILHWLVSQTIFLARVTMRRDGMLSAFLKESEVTNRIGGEMPFVDNTFSGLGYSDLGLLLVIAYGVALIMVCILVAIIGTYPKGLPVGGTNSAIISAACHLKPRDGVQHEEQEGCSALPLQWGVTSPGDPDDRIGHCSFSSKEVEMPQVGCLYAGSRF